MYYYENMIETMIALERNDLGTALRLGSKFFEGTAGVTFDPDEEFRIPTSGKPELANFTRAILFARRQLRVNAVLLDPRLNQDKPLKMKREIEHYAMRGPREGMFSGIQRPSHLTVSYFTNREPKELFIKRCTQLGVEPVCYVTSSRSTDLDQTDRGLGSEDFAKLATEACSQTGFKTMLVAATDAPFVKSENPDMKVIATGCVLTEDETTNHPRSALISEVAPFIDVAIYGSAVMSARDQFEALALRQQAAMSAVS